MNSPLDEGQLMSFEHMNRAQKRAFILRDQLKYDEEQHLDVFIDGLRNPEPPRYRRTSSGVQPVFEEVTLKHSTTHFDLGNVEFSDKSIRRVHLTCVGDSYEMHESDAISSNEDDFNSVPLNYYVAQKIMPSFKKKYEAIYARMQRINDMRKHVYEQACNRLPKTSSRFKEGKSLGKLMSSNPVTESIQSDSDSRKRPSDSVVRHPLNKKKRISVENVTSSIKTDVMNRLSDQTKVDLFNAFVKSAFPDLDNLLMASWNVVSIFVNVGSEDLMLHNSIGDLHEVLLRFNELLGKKKKGNVGGGAASPRNDARNGSVRNTPSAQGPGPLDGSGDLTSRDRSRDRLVEIPAGAHEGAYVARTESPNTTCPRRSNARYEAEGRPVSNLRHQQLSSNQQQKSSPLHQPDSEQPTPKQTPSRHRPQSLSDLLMHSPPKDARRGSHDILKTMAVSIEEDTISSIEEGYTDIQAQMSPAPDKPSPPYTSTSNRRAELAELAEQRARMPPPSSSQPQYPAQRDAKRYGMFTSHHGRSSADERLDSLFVVDDDDEDGEAVQIPGMQEVDLEMELADSGGKKGVSLGKSILGAPKRPPNATGEAPVAPMMHISSAGKAAGQNGADGRAQ
ncbi:hypothetical protein PMIN01_08353 [Paraphaeosphaeria minitans]|uniref:Uncharacterized protein n=1 Tax=Paraphaeosphaeria minitans TaxID=565426 RepID=A0A9P6GFE8_9PLEO|nr:hypothetical protein PMIN01_08353 [Paraphaeosphaeria minitans]